MVAEPDTQELQAEPEPEVEAPADETVTEDAAEDQVETEPSEGDTPDPLADVVKRLGEIEEQAKTLGGLDPNQINTDRGRLAAVQSGLDQLKNVDPTAAINPRIEGLSEEIGELFDLLAASELLPEETRAVIRQRRSERTTSRQIEALEAKIEAQKSPPTTPEEESVPQQSPEALAATNRVIGYAQGKGVDPSAIPADAWQPQTGETLQAAVTRVRAVIDGLASEDGATDRVATRKTAAGSGSPNGTGGPTGIDTILTKLDEQGASALSDKEREQAAAHLDMKI